MKPLPLATATYQLTGGVDSKVHGLTLPPPKLQLCENAFVDQTGSMQRRNGRTSLPADDITGTTSTFGWVATGLHNGRLLGYTPLTAHEFNADDNRWVDKGGYNGGWDINAQGYNAGAASTGMNDIAALGDFRCLVYDVYDIAANRIHVWVTVMDSHGTRYTRDLVEAPGSTHVSGIRVVAFGAMFYVVYNDIFSPNNLMTFRIDTTSPATLAASITAAPVIADAVGKNAFGGLNRAVLDLQVDPVYGPLVAFRRFTSATTLRHGFISATTGLLVTTGDITTPLPIVTVFCAAAPDGFQHGFCWTEQTAPGDIYAAMRSFNGTVWSAPVFTLAIESSLTGLATTRACAAIFDNNVTMRVFYDNDINISEICVRQATVNATSGLVDPRVEMLLRSSLASQPFKGLDGAIYYWAFPAGGKAHTQAQLYLMRYDNVLFGVCDSVGPSVLRPFYCVSHVSQVGSNFYSVNQYEIDRVGERFLREVTLQMEPTHSHIGIQDGQTTILPGGYMQQYDGTSFVELGFLTFVEMEIGDFTETVGVGLDPGIYSYRIIPEWVNAVGEREQGTDGGAVQFTVTGGVGNQVTIEIDVVPWTRRTEEFRLFSFAVYRTLVNPSGSSPHHFVGTVLNDPSLELDTVTFVDDQNDSDIEDNAFLYSEAELDNGMPGAGSVVAAGNGRVFIGAIPGDPNLIQYSKLRGHGVALAFNEGLTIQIPESAGVITGLAVFNESLIVFTERSVFRVNGDGANNTGTSGGYTSPVLVQSDCGALGQRTICVTPAGIMFESPKGKMIMRANFAVDYIGAPLEKLTEPGAPMGTTMVPALQQVRFTYAEVTHVYDYFHGQWYVYTHGADGPTSLWLEKLASPHAGGVHVDDEAIWTDDGVDYVVTIRLAWMHGPSIRSDLSVRKLALTGQARDNVNLTLSLAKDQEAVNQTVETDFVPGRLMMETRVRKQVCSHIEVTISDSTLGGLVQPTAGFRLNELTFELALRDQHIGRDNGP